MEQRIRLFVELFSVATGVSFLAAALAQIIVFASWGLDFTALASVEDVIMGGIRMLVILGMITLFLIVCTMSGHVYDAEGSRSIRQFTLRRVIYVTLVVFVFVALLAYFILFPGNIRPGIAFLMMWALAIALAAGIFGVFIYTSPISLRDILAFSRKTLLNFFALDMFFAVLFMFIALFRGYPGLSLETATVLPPSCQKGHEILWIGSRALVVECRGEISAIVRSDTPLVLRPSQ